MQRHLTLELGSFFPRGIRSSSPLFQSIIGLLAEADSVGRSHKDTHFLSPTVPSNSGLGQFVVCPDRQLLELSGASLFFYFQLYRGKVDKVVSYFQCTLYDLASIHAVKDSSPPVN